MPSSDEKPTPPNATTNWWVLFPFKGLDVSDTDLGLECPLFGDATVVSTSHADELVDMIRPMDQEEALSESDRRFWRTFIDHPKIHGEFDSFIAVRRRAPEQLSGSLAHTDLRAAAEARAKRVAACLCLAVLAESAKWRTCGFVEQMPLRATRVIALADSGNWSFTVGSTGAALSARSNTLRLSRSDLRKMLSTPTIAALSDILTSQRPSGSRSLVRAITEAAIHLAEAVHAHDGAGQVLGSVTATEILVSEYGEPFEQTKIRLRELIGEQTYLALDCDRVFHARHQFVHRGKAPAEGVLPVHATGMALQALITYSELASRIPSRSHILRYLDFLATAEQADDLFTASERTTLSQLRRHHPRAIAFPWFTENLVEPERQDGQT